MVIAARNFNPTIFSQLWLSKEGIFLGGEIENNFVYTPVAVNLTTPEIAFLAVPDRIQLSFLNDKPNRVEFIRRIMGGIVKKLPHTPFHAVGFNFTWVLIANKQKDFSEIVRKLFLSEKNPLGHYFAEENCRFGFYVSKDIDIGRLRLDIKPIVVPPAGVGDISEGLQLTFNIHRDLTDDSKVERVLAFLDGWDSAFALAGKITEEVGGTWGN